MEFGLSIPSQACLSTGRNEMTQKETENISIHNLVRAAAMLAGAFIAGGLLYRQFNGMPGVAWTALLTLAISVAMLGRRCWKRPVALDALGKFHPTFISTAIGAVVFGLVMPALFPNGAYERAPWLIWVDGMILGTGLMAVPMVRAHLYVAAALARRAGARS